MIDRSYEQEARETGQAITINAHSYSEARYTPDGQGLTWRHFKLNPKYGRYYELVNSRWHRVKGEGADGR